MDKIRLLLVDDHNILRQGLATIFEEYDDICIVAEAENGHAMVNKYFSFKPDVVLTDIEMPDMNGIVAAEQILKKEPDAKIIFLTMHNSDEYVYKILEINASGLVSKEIIKSELVHAIRTVASGEKYFMGKSEAEIKRIKTTFSDKKEREIESRSISLTPAEKRILLLIAEGKTSNEIADTLGKGKRTIDSSRSSIMSKLNLQSLPQLIRYAVHYSFSKKNSGKKIL